MAGIGEYPDQVTNCSGCLLGWLNVAYDMRFLLIAGALIVQAPPTYAGETEWIFLSAAQGREYYVNKSSITKVSASVRQARLKQVLRSVPQDRKIEEIHLLVEYECVERRVRLLEGTALFLDGTRETKREALPWDQADDPLSNGGIQLNFVCFGKVPNAAP